MEPAPISSLIRLPRYPQAQIEATGPGTRSWYRKVSMSEIASPPPTSMVATSTRTWPGDEMAKDPEYRNPNGSSCQGTLPLFGLDNSPSAF
jgi:hypothetical protein